MQQEEIERIEEEKETGRLEAFCDGVFAIAMTLLVFELKTPLPADIPAGGNLLTALGHQWPVLLAFVTSFASILIMWVNHHNLMMQIKRVDHTFLLLNGLLLFGATIVPFTTNLIAEHLESSGARVAAVIYSGGWMLVAISYNLLWRYASYRARLLARDADLTFIRHINAQYLVGPILYLASFLLAFFSAMGSFALIGLIAIFFAFPVSLTSRLTAFTRPRQ
jgi:uncharacterized membrane protein